MGLFGRDKDDEGQGALRFQMREKLMSVGDDYWIEDSNGHRAYKVDGKAMRMRDTFILEDAHGNELAKIQEKAFTIRDKMIIERPQGKATVQKKLIGIRDHFKIDVENGPELKAHGKVLDHEYKIERARRDDRQGVEEVVPGPGELRHRDRARPGRGAAAGDRGLPRRHVPGLAG